MVDGKRLWCSWPLKCHDKVSRADRCHIFEKFWALQSKVRQWEFINQYTEVAVPKERSKKYGARMKNLSRNYYFKLRDGRKEKVCQSMFLLTLDISEKFVRTATTKSVSSDGLTTSPDKRGRHKKNNQEKIDKLRSTVDEHIRLFEAVPSHFCRKDSKRKYLEPGLSINKMYQMYLKWMDKTKPGAEQASKRTYHDYFCTNFNNDFHSPRKDQCDLCNVFVRCNADQKSKLQEKFDDHQKKKEQARKLKDQDKAAASKDSTICFAIFDLQKVLNCPKSESSILYYKRKLSTYNFTVFDGARKHGKCYIWHEGEGKRGANEISSCLEEFISDMTVKHQVSDFRFWSDNCSGQNKNKFLFALYTHLSQKLKIKITHRYLEKGHTQNEADSVHACIEKAVKRKDIFEPQEYITAISQAKQSGEPYQVVSMAGEFKNLHTLATKHQKWVGHKDVKWKQVREIIVYPEEPGKVSVRHDLSDNTPLISISVSLPTRGRPVNLSSYHLPNAYKGALKLKAAKISDLASLCVSGIIPSAYLQLYCTLRGFREEYKKQGGTNPGRQNDVEIHPDSEESDGGEHEVLEGADEPDTDVEE